MKKILFAAMAALAITSCTQNEEIEAPAQKAEISFKTVVNKTSRATPTINAKFDNFKVYAYNTGNDALATVTTLNTTTFMPGVNVEKKGSPLAWTIDGTYYWPATAKVQFFAYSPMASTALTGWEAAGKYPSFSYTINAVDTQEDLVIAQAIDKDKATHATAGVDLSFKHILTQVNFSAKGETDGYTYTISSIKIGKVFNTSTYTFAGINDTPAGAWVSATNQITEPYTYAGDYSKTALSTTVATSLAKTDESSALFLMPQTLPDDAVITVNYSVKDTNSNEIFNGNGEVSLKGVIWEAGKSINYTLVLSNNGKEVKFNPTVDDNWSNSGSDNPTPEPTPAQP